MMFRTNHLSLWATTLACAALLWTAGCSTAHDNDPAAPHGANVNHNAGHNMANANNTGHDMANMGQDMGRSSPNAAQAPYDLQFLDTMSAHHQGAVDMAQPAATKAQSPALKAFAAKIVADQKKEIAQMQAWREAWYKGQPPAVNMEMSGMMSSMRGMDMKELNAASGKEFDVLFVAMMTPHHRGAVTMAQEALTKAQHPEIKQLAQTIIAAQETEIKQMQAWQAQWAK